MEKRRILFLTTSYPSHENDPSSVFLAKLATALKKKGYSVLVLAPSDGTFFGRREVNGVQTVRFGYFWPRRVHRLTTGGGGIPENLSRSRLARFQLIPMMLVFLLRTLVEVRDSDLIYANWLGAGIIAAAANLVTGTPMVVSFRGDDGYLARDRPLWRFPAKWVLARASMIAPVSNELADIFADLGVDRRKIRVPRFGVDTEMFFPNDDARESGDEVSVLFVGSLIPRKGLEDLLKAADHADLANIRITVAGDGFLREQLHESCARLGLTERVEWKGLVTPVEVALMMRSSDILCVPSYMEGTPNVAKEAMASGIPVVATRVGGIPELVVERETALLYDPGNIEQLRECLKRLAEDSDLRKNMGRAGYELLTQTNLTWDTTADEFHEIFCDVLGRKPAPDQTSSASKK